MTNTPASPSQVRITMSETRSRLRPGSNVRQTAPSRIGREGRAGRSIRETTRSVRAARTSVAAKPIRIPATTPKAPISAPPTTGETSRGIRRRIACTVNPMARRPRGSASAMTANVAGLAMLFQPAASARPANTQGHDGLRR